MVENPFQNVWMKKCARATSRSALLDGARALAKAGKRPAAHLAGAYLPGPTRRCRPRRLRGDDRVRSISSALEERRLTRTPRTWPRPAPRDSRQPPGHHSVPREADQAPARRRRPTTRQAPAMTAARPPATRATRGPRSIPVLARPPCEVSVDSSSPPTRLSSAG